jgi:hypothetical protein
MRNSANLDYATLRNTLTESNSTKPNSYMQNSSVRRAMNIASELDRKSKEQEKSKDLDFCVPS